MNEITSKKITLSVWTVATIVIGMATCMWVWYTLNNKVELILLNQVAIQQSLDKTITPLVMKHEKQLAVLNEKHEIKD